MLVRIDGLKLTVAFCAALVACSGDDDDNTAPAEECPSGADVGDTSSCECEDGDRGVQRCRSDGTLSTCDCDGSTGVSGSGGDGDPDGGGSGDGGSGGSGGDSGDGGAGDSGSGGSSGAGGDEDGGADPGTTDAGSMLPTSGDQLAVCTEDGDCDSGYSCYDQGPGQHFCTLDCTEDTDCMDLAGATYTCSPDDQCEVECANTQDRDSCPDGLSCVRVGGQGQGGNQFRCKYSENAGQSGDGDAWSACLAAGDCDDGLECIGAFGPIPGHCSQPCEMTDECTAQPSSGDIMPTCEQIGMMPGACALDCSADPDSCPDDMSCGFGARCSY